MSSASFLGVLGVSFVLSFPPCLLAECTSGWNVTVRCVWLYTPLTDWLQNMVNTRKPQQPLRRQYKERLCHGCHTLHAQQQRAGHSVKTPSPSLPGGGRVCPGPLPERTQPWPGTAYGTGGMSRYRGWRERPQPAGHMVVLRVLGVLEREQAWHVFFGPGSGTGPVMPQQHLCSRCPRVCTLWHLPTQTLLRAPTAPT